MYLAKFIHIGVYVHQHVYNNSTTEYTMNAFKISGNNKKLKKQLLSGKH